MKKILTLLLVLTATSCSRNLSDQDSKSMQGKRISVTLRESASMQYLTPYHVALMGIPSATISLYQGNKIVASNEAKDPSVEISKELQAFLKEKLKLIVTANSDLNLTKTTNLEQIVESFKGKSDYVIDVYTTEWKLSYLSNNWSKYTLIHSSRMRLVDINKSQVISEHGCRAQPNKIYDKEVLKNDSKIFNQELKDMVNACVDFYKKQAFTSLK